METKITLCSWADCYRSAVQDGRWCPEHLAEQVFLRSCLGESVDEQESSPEDTTRNELIAQAMLDHAEGAKGYQGYARLPVTVRRAYAQFVRGVLDRADPNPEESTNDGFRRSTNFTNSTNEKKTVNRHELSWREHLFAFGCVLLIGFLLGWLFCDVARGSWVLLDWLVSRVTHGAWRLVGF